MKLHIICERDVGLFSLIQQVIANIPWAMSQNRIPVVFFRSRTCYWTPGGYNGKDTVWEYYFEPVFPEYPISSIPATVVSIIAGKHPDPFETGYFADEDNFVSAHFGDHPELQGKSLFIPYLTDDPDDRLREQASHIIEHFLRPRDYILQKAGRFIKENFEDKYVIGVHIRGTDAVSKEELRPHRRDSLILPNYKKYIEHVLKETPGAGIFVASDDQSSIDYIRKHFGSSVMTYDSIRHNGGKPSGTGPTGWIMPAYVAENRNQAAQNGEEAIIEYLLLSQCQLLIHNGASLARTVLLARPGLPHLNTHQKKREAPLQQGKSPAPDQLFCLVPVDESTGSPDAENLSGAYRIMTAATGAFWREDSAAEGLISARNGAQAEASVFILEKQADASYRIRTAATQTYLHYNGWGDGLISTRYQVMDDFIHFYFEAQEDGYYRIKSKADGKYLHGDLAGDKLISARDPAKADLTQDVDFIKQVKAAKASRRSSPVQYREHSEIAFIVHSFNRESNIDQIISGLRLVKDHELIVCDDGSSDHSRENWIKYLDRPNDFLILSNDLHEIRILDRAIRFASAELICLVQDDDLIPPDTGWLHSALDQFNRHPDLAIMGGFMGFHGFYPDEDKVIRLWGSAPFQFVEHVNIGPYFIRKAHYEKMGGWDYSFSKVGEPAICFDNELCLRAWTCGYQVGYQFVPFKGPEKKYSLNGGTMLFSPELRRSNQLRNEQKVYNKYEKFAAEIAEKVKRANLGIGITTPVRKPESVNA